MNYKNKFSIMHPHLDFDRTGAMIDAAHEIGMHAPVYITAGRSHYDAENHPGWHAVSKQEYQTSVKTFSAPELNCHTTAVIEY